MSHGQVTLPWMMLILLGVFLLKFIDKTILVTVIQLSPGI